MTSKADDKWLKSYVDRNALKHYVNAPSSSSVDTNTTTSTSLVDRADTFLEDVTSDNPDIALKDKDYNAQLRLAKLRKRAEMADAVDQEKAARLQAKQDEKDAQKELDEREEQERTQAEAIRRVTTRTISGIGDQTGALADRVGTLPTMGGIGMMIAILAILLFTIVRVNPQGDTRLKQLWYMLNGRATIKGRQQVTAAVSIPGTGNSILGLGTGATGVGGTFGTGTAGIGTATNPGSNPVVAGQPPTTPGGFGGPDLTHSSTDLGF